MTVQELIEKLQKLPPEAPIYVDEPGCGCNWAGGEREPWADEVEKDGRVRA